MRLEPGRLPPTSCIFPISSVGSSLLEYFPDSLWLPGRPREGGSCPEGLPTPTGRAVPIPRMQSRMGTCCAASLLWRLCQELQSPDQMLPPPKGPVAGLRCHLHTGGPVLWRSWLVSRGQGGRLLWFSLMPGQAGCPLCARRMPAEQVPTAEEGQGVEQ